MLRLLLTLLAAAMLFPALPAAASGASLDDVDAYVLEQIALHQIPAIAVGVVQGDRIAFMKGYGEAGGVPITPQSPFLLASVSKSFTGLAIVQLVEQGRVDLDAPVRTYLPWFDVATPGAGEAMTVRNLLNQTSGFSTTLGNQPIVRSGPPTLENHVRALRDVTLKSPVGRRYEYSNTNFRVAGMIVEAVSGQPYAAYMQEHVFGPLGMVNTWAVDPALDQPAFVPTIGQNGQPLTRRLAASGTPSGHIVSSIEDMGQWLIAQLNGGAFAGRQILGPDALAASHAPGARMSPTSTYSTGWVERDRGGVVSSVHNGGIAGHRTVQVIVPGAKIGVVVLASLDERVDPADIDGMGDQIASMVLGKPVNRR